MAHRTPWSNSSSLPSDRLKPSRPSTPKAAAASSNKGKGKGKDIGPPKSAAVVALETLIDGLNSNAYTKEKDPLGGCFCQAREHSLSPYTPICHRCGLILCTLNSPHRLCPSCSRPLLSDSARELMIDQLKSKVSETIQKEYEDAERAVEEARTAAGAFPVLAASASTGSLNNGSQITKSMSNSNSHPQLSSGANAHAPPRTHKVLSLGSGKSKKAVLTTYGGTSSPSPHSTQHNNNPLPKEPVIHRVPPPPSEIDFVKLDRKDGKGDVQRAMLKERPWANLRGDRPVPIYVPPLAPVVDGKEGTGQTSTTPKGTKKKRKGKAKENIENEEGIK